MKKNTGFSMASEAALAAIRSRLLLSSFIGQRVKLMRKGRHFTGLCPFHQERTPSFIVNDEQGIYRCFGCGARGDLIDYVRWQEGLSFPEALEQLADRAGVLLEKPSPKSLAVKEREKNIHEALHQAAQLFHNALRTHPEAEEYLYHRGIGKQHIKQYMLGFAPGHGMISLLMQKGFSKEILIEAGLLGAQEDGHLYPRFRQRLMFPIQDEKRKIIGFGGRSLKNEQPKYLNSPETKVFTKGHQLYRSPSSYGSLKKEQPLIIVEGYLDVISVGDYFPAVASLGTALTREQLEKIWKKCDRPILCFDGDEAGRKATLKTCLLALSHLRQGVSLKVALLPWGQDPQSLLYQEPLEEALPFLGQDRFPEGGNQAEDIEKKGVQASFSRCIESALPLSSYLYQEMHQGKSVKTPEEKVFMASQWKAWVSTIPDKDVAKAYMDFFYEERRKKTPQSYQVPHLSYHTLHSKTLLVLLIMYPDLIQRVQEHIPFIQPLQEEPWGDLQKTILLQGVDLDLEKRLTASLAKGIWQEEKRKSLCHVPKALLAGQLEEVQAYWLELFSHHTMVMHQKQEMNHLKSTLHQGLMTGQGDQIWKRLQSLSMDLDGGSEDEAP